MRPQVLESEYKWQSRTWQRWVASITILPITLNNVNDVSKWVCVCVCGHCILHTRKKWAKVHKWININRVCVRLSSEVDEIALCEINSQNIRSTCTSVTTFIEQNENLHTATQQEDKKIKINEQKLTSTAASTTRVCRQHDDDDDVVDNKNTNTKRSA